MRLSEIKGVKAWGVMPEIIDPIADIAMDTEFQQMKKAKKPKLFIAKAIIKTHKEALIQILAALEMKDVEEYRKEMTVLSLPMQLMDIMNDEQVAELFGLQSQTEETSFGSATENTEADEQ